MTSIYRGIRNSLQIVKVLPLLTFVFLLVPVQPVSVLAQAPAKNSRKVTQRVEPKYPDFLRYGHFQARVVADVTVLPNGNVSGVEIKSGNPMFAQYASEALMKWKYVPGPEKTVEEVTINFNSSSR